MKKIPTLNAWIDSPEKQADYLLACFYTSENLQSTLSPGKIHSLPYLIQRFGKNPMELQTQTHEAIRDLLKTVFEVSHINVSVTTDPEKKNHLTIRLDCTINVNGREVSLGQLIQYVDGRVRTIQNLI